MRRALLFFAAAVMILPPAATAKVHVVSLGKAMPVKLPVGPSEQKSLDITVRPLSVDGQVKDFTTGESHDVTDREFVVRRAYRINDALPEDSHKTSRWLWQRGGWLLVDRKSGNYAAEAARFRSFLLAGELVSRLRSLLRHLIHRRKRGCAGC